MSKTAYSAGLPPQSVDTGALSVGIHQAFPAGNARLNLADKSEWLRAGLVVPVAGYKDAAKLGHMKAHIFTRTASAATTLLALATNGTGTFVAVVQGDATNVYVSTDHGVTWATHAHNAAFQLCAIVWNGSRFLAVGSSSSALYGAHSTDGLTWTAVSIIASVSSGSLDSADVAWDGSTFVAMCAGSSPTCCATSPVGTGSWTARAVPGAVAAGSRVGGGGLGFLMTVGTSTTAFYSTNSGATWSSTTLTSNPVGKPMVGATFAAVLLDSNQVTYSTNFTTFNAAAISISGQGASGAVVNISAGGAWTMPVATGIAYSTDAINWTLQQVATDSVMYSLPAQSARLACIGGSSIVQGLQAGSGQMQYALSTPARSNGIGGAGTTGMWRIK